MYCSFGPPSYAQRIVVSSPKYKKILVDAQKAKKKKLEKSTGAKFAVS
jgi:hypothetical protein